MLRKWLRDPLGLREIERNYADQMAEIARLRGIVEQMRGEILADRAEFIANYGDASHYS